MAMGMLIRDLMVIWLLVACGNEAVVTGSSMTAVGQAGLPIGGPEIPGAPVLVTSRVPLPYCGAEISGFSEGNPYDFIDLVAGASECYRGRADAGEPAELITVGYTIEGDPSLTVHRLMPDGREIIFWDATQDKFGPMAWVMIECESYSGSANDDVECSDTAELTDG
jgi:hypothetical protein